MEVKGAEITKIEKKKRQWRKLKNAGSFKVSVKLTNLEKRPITSLKR